MNNNNKTIINKFKSNNTLNTLIILISNNLKCRKHKYQILPLIPINPVPVNSNSWIFLKKMKENNYHLKEISEELFIKEVS
jgi:hypothetical protein